MSEYSGLSVSNGCNYSNLTRYNNLTNNASDTLRQPQVPANVAFTQGKYIVPTFAGAASYNSLVINPSGSCSGYGNITNAYGSGSQSCAPMYQTKLCSQ